jgi:CheY-like chemotaxis protein
MSPKYKILVVEDEKVVIYSAQKILRPEGFVVDSVSGVDEALRKIEMNHYELILTDLMLPRISGLELTEIVNREYPEIPIIVITGYATWENAVQCLKLGAFDFIPKPFAYEELLSVVYRAVNFVESKKKTKEKSSENKRPGKPSVPADASMDYYLLGEHAWALLDQNGSAKMGAGETFHETIGTVQQINFPPLHELVIQGNVLGRIGTDRRLTHTVWAPLSGKVIEINRQIERNGSLVSSDPFLQGWLVRIIPTNLEAELLNLIIFKRQ